MNRLASERGVMAEDDPVARAGELVDEDWESEGRRRTQLAKQAIKLWPDAQTPM